MSDQPSNGTQTNGHGNKSAPENGPQESKNTSNEQQDDGLNFLSSATRIGTNLKERLAIKKGPPGGYDSTPLPHAPQGYTVRFIFHSATNLPPADVATASSDPFLIATLMGTQPKRHKEDPDLVHRTKTIRRTTEPEWEDEWVVANVPPTGFTLKCRMYDEDYPDANDRLGNVTIKVPSISESWRGIPPPGKVYEASKRSISKRAYLIKAMSTVLHSDVHMTPKLRLSMELLGPSEPPHAHMYTIGPTTWVKHFSPLIGYFTGVKVNANEDDDARDDQVQKVDDAGKKKRKTKKYDFQANEMQLEGPVPPKLYHRFVEFKPIVASVYASAGLRGKILNKALHKQHERVYNFDRTTEYGSYDACSKEAALQFLKLVHFDEGGRIFTYVLTLDGMFRFTETGKEFGIDMLSKHTMHSDVETYIAFSGEFFIRRLKHPVSSDDPSPDEKTHPQEPIDGGPPKKDPPFNPAYYQLIIDNDSGTYRPDKSLLPLLKQFFEANFPSLGVVAMHWEDQDLQSMKQMQRNTKKNEGRMINLVMNRSQSSISSAESELEDRETTWERGHKSKREAAYEALEDPSKVKDAVKTMIPGMHGNMGEQGQSSK